MLVRGGYAAHMHVPDDPDPDFSEPTAMTDKSTGLSSATSMATVAGREKNPQRRLDCVLAYVF